ncbi:MAG: hypothetical protein ACLP50_13075, partial [Solirubrobacteraceae bacterium]
MISVKGRDQRYKLANGQIEEEARADAPEAGPETARSMGSAEWVAAGLEAALRMRAPGVHA